MMKRQDGYGGGYYTGIATVANGKLHTAKVVGDMQNFLNETDGINFSGTIGFLHSRSKSGGYVEWGQPFVSSEGDLAYIANGTAGIIPKEELNKRTSALIGTLIESGFTFRSRINEVLPGYPVLPDGGAIHTSELMRHYIAFLIERKMNLLMLIV